MRHAVGTECQRKTNLWRVEIVVAVATCAFCRQAETAEIFTTHQPDQLFVAQSWVSPDHNDREGVIPAFFQPSSPVLAPSRRSLVSAPDGSVLPVSSFSFGAGLRIGGATGRRTNVATSVAVAPPTAVRADGGTFRIVLAPNAGFAAVALFLAETAAKNASNGKTTDGKNGNDSAVDKDGSYWVPARLDLDTALNKIDGRLIESLTIIRGPYSSRYGPGFSHTDVDLIGSPRYQNGFENHGEIGGSYKRNGNEWNGFKSLWGGDERTGYRFDYSHRGGIDYTTGDGNRIPGDYETRTFALALGHDFNSDHSIEFQLLRLDQFDVNLPGQAFDIDSLATNSIDMEYQWTNAEHFDEFVLDAWYNNTALRGSGGVRDPDKTSLFQSFALTGFDGITNVESASTGYRGEFSWLGDDWRLSAGSDLRHIGQALDEISSGAFVFFPWTGANSPIPNSHTVNPGLFVDYSEDVMEAVTVKVGGRVDWFNAQVDEPPPTPPGVGVFGLPYADVVGSSQLETNETLWSAYVAAERSLSENLIFTLAAGHAQRPPNLTELYAAEPFMFLLQNGVNIVTGDPLLGPERLWQIDAEFKYDAPRFRGRLRGYHKWINDYITYENMGGTLDQVNLKFVNTELATIVGFDFDVQYDPQNWLTTFSTLSYADGRDQTRNGTFATMPSNGVARTPSVRVAGAPRGTFADGTFPLPDEEPLPGILPLSLVLGLRIHEPVRNQECAEGLDQAPRWSVELSGRFVDEQNRVAASLGESPTAGFTVIDLRSYWQVSDRLRLLGGIENLTDAGYRTHLDFRNSDGVSVNRPGISFYFGSELAY